MRKSFSFFLCLLLLSALPGRAQELRKWSEGLPDWSGFQIAGPARDSSSYASFTMIKNKVKVVRDGVVYHYLNITAAIDPSRSWVKADQMSDEELALIRQDFDLLEYFARLYRDDLLFEKDRDGTQQKNYIERFHNAQGRVREGESLSRYALQAGEFDITQVPVTFSERSSGVSFGLFTGLPLGSLGRLLYPSFGVSAGYEFRKGPSSLLIDASVGLNAFKRHYYGLEGSWINHSMASSVCLSVQYGRELAAAGPWRLSAGAGPCYSARIFNYNRNAAYTIGGIGLSEGLCADLLFRRAMIFSSRRPERSDAYLRLRLYSDQIWNGPLKNIIPTVNLSVGLHFDSRSISRK